MAHPHSRLPGRGVGLVVVLGLALFSRQPRAQSLTYSSGQNVSPAFEGWELNDDGSYNFLFGYMNRNWQEEIDVPVGPENNIQPGGPDTGQPTHLLPRRNRFVFRVHAPKDFGDKEMIWTLTTHGKTEKAYATLRLDYRLENIDLMSETGALGAGTSSPEVRANQPPVIKIEGAKTRTATVGQPITLAAIVTDDGIPKPRGVGRGGAGGGRGGPGANGNAAAGQASGGPGAPGPGTAITPPSRSTVGKTTGLHTSWFVYRGAGKVTFSPDQIEAWEDTREGANSPWAPRWTPPPLPPNGRWETHVTFAEPGTYVVRGLADDGGLTASEDVNVNVTR
jgi:hypothetical protein